MHTGCSLRPFIMWNEHLVELPGLSTNRISQPSANFRFKPQFVYAAQPASYLNVTHNFTHPTPSNTHPKLMHRQHHASRTRRRPTPTFSWLIQFNYTAPGVYLHRIHVWTNEQSASITYMVGGSIPNTQTLVVFSANDKRWAIFYSMLYAYRFAHGYPNAYVVCTELVNERAIFALFTCEHSNDIYSQWFIRKSTFSLASQTIPVVACTLLFGPQTNPDLFGCCKLNTPRRTYCLWQRAH